MDPVYVDPGVVTLLVAGPANAAVRLTDVYGIDNVTVGRDADGVDISYPLSATQDADGFYEVTIYIDVPGEYFADFDVAGKPVTQVVKVGLGQPVVDTPVVLLVAGADAESAYVVVNDRSQAQVGVDDVGDDIAYPMALHKVRAGRWYSDPITFVEALTARVSVSVGNGPTARFTLKVGGRSATPDSQVDGLRTTDAVSMDDWITLRELGTYTGWRVSTQATMMRQLRAMAVQTFIETTGIAVPRANGVWHGIAPSVGVIYLPMPIILPSDGGIPIVIEAVDVYGNVTIVADPYMVNTYGERARIPTIAFYTGGFAVNSQSPEFGSYRVTATWGFLNLHTVKQALVGLARWHSLAFGVGPDEARDRNTVNRTIMASSRDRREDYAASAVSIGLTGDVETDRLLAKLTIARPAVAYKRQNETW